VRPRAPLIFGFILCNRINAIIFKNVFRVPVMRYNPKMQNDYRSQLSKCILAILFLVLFLGSSGTNVVSSSALQSSKTPTPSNFPLEETAQPGNQNPTPSTNTNTSTITPIIDAFAGTETLPSTAADNPTTSTPKPLPAIFASGAHAANELIAGFKPSTRAKRIKDCLQAVDVQIIREIGELHSFVLNIESGDLRQTFNHLLGCPGALYVEPNFLLQAADTIPNDPNWGLQYGLANIHAPQGWDLTTGSTVVTIAIIDTGVDYGHLDLVDKLVPGYDFVNNDAAPQDDNGHGTHVAGIAAASSNNGVGVAGVSWGARIMPVKVLNASGGGTYADTASGVIWAADHGAQVINLSLGGTGPSAVLADAINYAHSQGVVVVAAAGNTGSNFVLYPARYPNVIAVAKTNSTNNWDGSNYGPEIDLAAPGASIYSTVVGGYDYKSGSSMSTGYVSGVAAILKGIAGNTSPDLIESQLESTALDIEFAGWDEYTGAGLIQMDGAIQLAMSLVPPTEEPDSSSSGSIYIPGQIAPTNTPIPTWTVSPAIPIETVTTEHTTVTAPVETETETSAGTPTQVEKEVEIQGQSGSRNYLLPCAGLALILLGIFSLWYLRRKDIEGSTGM